MDNKLKNNMLFYKNNFIKQKSIEKGITVDEYNKKYLTVFGETCCLKSIGFISLDKSKIDSHICDYINVLEDDITTLSSIFNRYDILIICNVLDNDIHDMEQQLKKYDDGQEGFVQYQIDKELEIKEKLEKFYKEVM